MKYIMLVAALGSVLYACSPVASSPRPPQHNNIPATFAGDPGGPLIWLCATQPRVYEGVAEEDHYLQYQPCPAELVR